MDTTSDRDDIEQDDVSGEDRWRTLALQFDGHRMQALWHLRALVQNHETHRPIVVEFLSAPPLPGDHVLAQRLAQMNRASLHPDDLAIDVFATELKRKMRQRRQASAQSDWRAASEESLSVVLHEGVDKGDPAEVAILSMMLHQNGFDIAKVEKVPERQTEPAHGGRPKSLEQGDYDADVLRRIQTQHNES